MKYKDVFEQAGKFIYRNARPVEFARWNYHFENGGAEAVVKALAAYQNEDGGFGHALEADNWNVESTPITTWAAIGYLREMGFPACAEDMIQAILRYLDSGRDFAEGKWFNVVAGNNQYPHAIWWECHAETGEPDDNPTVSLAGFALRFAGKDSGLYEKAADIVQRAVREFMEKDMDEFHTVRCYCELLDYCETIEAFDLFDLPSFRDRLHETVNRVVCREPEKWFTEYVCKPSVFYGKGSGAYACIDRKLMEREVALLVERQLADGSFPITWQWGTAYEEFVVSANWWKSCQIIDNMLYLREFGR